MFKLVTTIDIVVDNTELFVALVYMYVYKDYFYLCSTYYLAIT